MSPRRRVLVSGWGMVTPIGQDAESSWSALLAGEGGVHRIRRFPAETYPVTFGAEAEARPETGDLKRDLALQAAREALECSGLRGGPRVGVVLGSEAARPSLDELALRVHRDRPPSAAEVLSAAPWRPAEDVAALLGGVGLLSTISTACTSSTQAVGEAALRIRRGELDAAVAGGVDVLVHPLMIAGFSLLGALSTRNDDPEHASRPFDVGRDGFVLGDGAGFLVLESEEHLRARGGEALGEILGYGASLNAYRITDSHPEGRGAAVAMRAALRDAGLAPEEVGWVDAHGTATRQNDASEARAIHRVFGEHARRLPVSSAKGAIGHLVAACGAVEAIFGLLALRDQVIPHTRNLVHPDPDCALELVMGEPREARLRAVLSNSFGFGGSNGVLALGPA